jgi:site-specific recombinase XerD
MTDTLPALWEGASTALAVRIDSELDAASRYANASKADASKRAYASDFALFTAWCTERTEEANPATVATVSRYLADMAESGLKVSTIRRRAAAIAYVHKLAGHEPPTNAELVRAVLSGITREKAAPADRKAPVTVDVIKKMLRLIPGTTIGTRDRALLLVGFAGALRRSELVALNIEDLERTDRGVLVHIRRSKTDQEGEGRTVAIPRAGKLKTLEALDAWIGTARLTAGPIFRNVRKGGVIADRLTDRSVALIVKKYAERAQLDPSLFSGHSLRAGFVTSAFDAGADAFRIADVTGHREIRTLRIYDRRAKFDKHAGRNFL